MAFEVESLVGAECAKDDVVGVELAVTVADGSCPAPVLMELSTELRNWHWSACEGHKLSSSVTHAHFP